MEFKERLISINTAWTIYNGKWLLLKSHLVM